MNLGDILTTIGGGAIVVLSFIEISPLKINPWKTIGRAFGRAINGDLETKIDNITDEVVKIKTRVDELQENIEANAANNCRIRILRFGDELLHDVRHSKDHFDQILLDIKKYNLYCDTHPEFENNVTKLTVARIKSVYLELLKNNGFL